MKKKGFTLIELLLVIAIITILSTFGLVKFNLIGKIKAKNEAKILANDIYYAKEKAMASGNEVTMTFTENAYEINQKEGLKVTRMEKKSVELKYLRKINDSKDVVTLLPSGAVINAQTLHFTSKDLLEDGYSIYFSVGVAGGYSNVKIDKTKY